MKRIILICTAALLTGCGIYKPYSRPKDIKTDSLYGAEYETTDTTTIADIRWQEMFTDPQLQSLIEKGLENNSDMQSALWRVKEAEAALQSARLAFLPSFNLAPNGGISSFDNHASPWTYTIPLAASWQIDIFGGLRNAKRKAKAVYFQTQEYRQAVRTQLISGIATYYYTLLMLDSQYEATRETAQSLMESAETMRAMKQAGMTTEAGVAQMEAAAYSAEASLNDLNQTIRETENAFCSLLGEVPHNIERGKLENQILPESIAAGVPLQLLSNRPDVRSAELGLEQAFYATAAARSALYPNLTLSGTLGWTNNAGSIVVNPGKLLLSATGSLTMPLFNARKGRNQLKIAKAQQEEAKLTFQQTLLNAGAEVNNALSLCQTSRAKVELRKKQIASLESAFESTQLLMRHSSTTYLEVLTAQQNLLSGRIAQITDRFNEIQGTINLYKALGGGRDEIAAPQDRKAARKAERASRKR